MKFIFSLKFMAISYVLLLFILAVLPINGKESAVNGTYVFQLRLDYLIHILLFLPWMIILLFNLKDASVNFFLFRPLIWLILGFVLVITTEGIQYFIPYRAFNARDLFSNSLGLIVGLGLYALLKTKFAAAITRLNTSKL